ncbi:probable cyclic nucleotide-gated ion channel 20, chloroplastic [Salvia miltiorrhiza]|uniref:probable cyclic nucleotide-gated ion channel 20, chloroplastic n=1 Tax=Salvia miltiorrhiza TaxID=226208 RepID=UPI0025ABA1B3|nr:probable cyclic nucleotide-gated ion channel 20, chloroplastic [Salvia miltiorrhiza]XP_057812391.1 probable cyclic nucleotide-gated ion channel 20, chloroplastic [Salvia miltiorrhiza]
MSASERDEIPMLPIASLKSDAGDDSGSRGLSTRTRSASMSIPSNSMDSTEYEPSLVGFTGPLRNARRGPDTQMSGPLYANRNQEFVFQPPKGALRQKATEPKVDRTEKIGWPAEDYMGKNEHLLRSGQLGMCNDPYCTTCPMYYNVKGRPKPSRTTEIFDAKFHNMLHGDGKGWAKRMWSFLFPYIPGVMNPHTLFVQRWNQFFVIACSFAVFLDPMFFFLLTVQKESKCIILNGPMTTALVVLRSMTDFIYLLHILLQFRLAYVAPESRSAGSGDLVDDPKKIARNYLRGYFVVDFFVVLPLPQIIILLLVPGSIGSSGANYAKNLLRAAILIQYIPRLWRFLPLVAGPSPTGFIFESPWANFVINLLTFVLASHVVGSCWYLFGLQRVNQCFRDACGNSNMTKSDCMMFIDCGHGNVAERFKNYNDSWTIWKNNENATACFGKDGFDYGIYENAVNLTTYRSLVKRYVYSLFWGFQQISTLAGNQVPSYFEWEVVFTMSIIGIGLLLFAWLIGNMQNFLQALGRRRLEMSLRRRDVEQWMSHRRFPEKLRSLVRDSERFTWAATRGVNEETLMENLPEDLQQDIRRHLFKFANNVRIFQLLDEPIIDAIREKLKTKTYIKGSNIMVRGGLINKMVFIIRGKMVSEGEDGIQSSLSKGDVCGEELLTWCLEHSSIIKDGKRGRIPGHRLLSNRKVTCLTNVEAFVLRGADLEEVTSHFARFLRSPRVEGAIRYESPYWRGLAARRIQVAWRYRKKRINRADSSSPPHN